MSPAQHSWGELASEDLAAPAEQPPASIFHAEHRIPASDMWPWLPIEGSGVLAHHPYCADCGLVRAVGSARAMDLGGLINLVARLGRALREGGHKLTESQRRLVLARLRAAGADDSFGLTRSSQEGLVAQVVGRSLGVPASVVETYLRSC